MLCGEATGDPISPTSSLQGLRETMFTEGGGQSWKTMSLEVSMPCVEKSKT